MIFHANRDVEGLPTQAKALIGYCVRMMLPQLRNLDVGIILFTHNIWTRSALKHCTSATDWSGR